MNEPLEIEAVRLFLADDTTGFEDFCGRHDSDALRNLHWNINQLARRMSDAVGESVERDTNARTAVMEARMKERGIAIPF